jgi:hypothetical protein
MKWGWLSTVWLEYFGIKTRIVITIEYILWVATNEAYSIISGGVWQEEGAVL